MKRAQEKAKRELIQQKAVEKQKRSLKGYSSEDLPDEKREKYQDESFDIDKLEHRKAQKKAKLRNLAKGNMNPNEKDAAEKKAGGPKLAFEGWKERASDAIKRVVKKKEAPKHDYGRDAGAIAAKKLRKKDHEKVNFLDPDD